MIIRASSVNLKRVLQWSTSVSGIADLEVWANLLQNYAFLNIDRTVKKTTDRHHIKLLGNCTTALQRYTKIEVVAQSLPCCVGEIPHI
jgi:hypothetical protein